MKENWGLYNSSFEHDACGIGAVVNIKGKKSNKVINDALDILENLKHRGGTGADENTGDSQDVIYKEYSGNDSEKSEHKFVDYLHSESHTVILDKHQAKPICDAILLTVKE